LVCHLTASKAPKNTQNIYFPLFFNSLAFFKPNWHNKWHSYGTDFRAIYRAIYAKKPNDFSAAEKQIKMAN
jgi:hypothetical protein